jgi:nucleotide-binding universal stress UspA family protein
MAAKRAHQKIVVAWDGSQPSATTFPLANIVGSQLGADVEILHVLEPGASPEEFAAAVRKVGLDGLEASMLRVETGDVVQTILAAAEEPDVALVVLTTHVTAIKEGRHLGSVARAVVLGTEKPVLLVRPEAPASRGEMRRLLLPADGTPKTAIALGPATELARRLGAALDLLYVAGPRTQVPDERGSIRAPRYVDQQQHEWPSWADEVGDRLARSCASCPPEVQVQVFLAQGNISAEIENFAIQHSSDAIVLVRRSRLQAGRARTLRSLLERAPCPVLILSGPED